MKLTRRAAFAGAGALGVASVMPAPAFGGAVMAAPAGRFAVTVTVDGSALLGPVRELTAILSSLREGDLDRGRSLVEHFKSLGSFVDTVHLDRPAAGGTLERLVVLQPNDRLLDCVSALRALRRNGDIVHEAHSASSFGGVAAPLVAGRGRGVESRSRFVKGAP